MVIIYIFFAYTSRQVVNAINFFFLNVFFVFNTDPRVNDWPLMDSPFPTLFMVITYLYIVTYLGPKVMANRKPFKLNNVLVLYNAGQVVFSFVMLWEVGSIAKIKINNRTLRLSNIIRVVSPMVYNSRKHCRWFADTLWMVAK